MNLLSKYDCFKSTLKSSERGILFYFLSCFDPSKQQGRIERTVIQTLVYKCYWYWNFYLIGKLCEHRGSHIIITRINGGKRNSILRCNSKRSFPTCFLSSKTCWAGVSDQLCACYVEFWWIWLIVISQMFKLNNLKPKEGKISPRHMFKLTLFLISPVIINTSKGEESPFLLCLCTCQSAVLCKSV